MNQLVTYFTFNGNCREAMNFYKSCFGGELYLQTIGESPMADQMPEPFKHYIMHATLRCSNTMIMGSDMVGEQGLVQGNSVSILIECQKENEIYQLYQDLSAGGQATQPIEHTFWGALFGGLTDKYGNNWLLQCPMEQVALQ